MYLQSHSFEKRNIALKVAYDGTHFFGWQKADAFLTIEGTLQAVLEKILQESVDLQAASRTDRGVHAEGQLVNFFTFKNVSLNALKRSLNALLPATIRILAIYEMPYAFHPTLHAQKKEYHYAITFGPIQLPHQRHFSWHVPCELDVAKMRAASLFFVGEHDFSSFCNNRKNLNYHHKCRLLETLDIVEPHEENLLLKIQGGNFLYKMVRNIVGTLVHVGRGKLDLEAIPSIFQARRRHAAGPTAPAHGLILKKIYYPQELIAESIA